MCWWPGSEISTHHPPFAGKLLAAADKIVRPSTTWQTGTTLGIGIENWFLLVPSCSIPGISCLCDYRFLLLMLSNSHACTMTQRTLYHVSVCLAERKKTLNLALLLLTCGAHPIFPLIMWHCEPQIRVVMKRRTASNVTCKKPVGSTTFSWCVQM